MRALHTVHKTPVKVFVTRLCVGVDGDSRRCGVGRDQVPDQHPVAQRISANTGQRGRIGRDVRPYQGLSIQRVALAFEIVHGGQTFDTTDSLILCQRIREALDDLQDRRAQHIVRFDQHQRQIVTAKFLLHLSIVLACRVMLCHQALHREINLELWQLQGQDECQHDNHPPRP